MNIVITLCGGSGSGKTYVSKMIQNAFPNLTTSISLDNYCLPHPELSFEERTKVNYDVPSQYDGDELSKDLIELKNNNEVNIPIYDFSNHARVLNKRLLVKPNKIIIVDGLFSFSYESILNVSDLKIYVDCSDDLRFQRRLTRDQKERGRSAESIKNQFYETVLPMHHLYVANKKSLADIVVSNNENEIPNIENIVNFIKDLLK